jgi:small subunit ribosomal protein S9
MLVSASLRIARTALQRSSALVAAQPQTAEVAIADCIRAFSTVSLRRPPPRRLDGEENQKFRTHAVSLELGRYYDEDEEEDDSPRHAYNWEQEEEELSEEVKKKQRELDEQKQRWLDNAKPPLRKPVIDERGRAYGRGGRKTASARVWIQPGFGHVVVNRKDFVDYFQRDTDRELILSPLAATATCGKFDVTAMVQGGGLTGQAGAIRHGLARALNHYNPDDYRPPLKRLGYLTRDPRKVERKKIGHLKARKKPQWVKR